jgi:hypothetical protein
MTKEGKRDQEDIIWAELQAPDCLLCMITSYYSFSYDICTINSFTRILLLLIVFDMCAGVTDNYDKGRKRETKRI